MVSRGSLARLGERQQVEGPGKRDQLVGAAGRREDMELRVWAGLIGRRALQAAPDAMVESLCGSAMKNSMRRAN